MKKKISCEKNDTWVGYNKDGKMTLSSKFNIDGKKYVVELEYSDEEYKKIIGEMTKARFEYEKNKLFIEMQKNESASKKQ
jgi:hypothetical protein